MTTLGVSVSQDRTPHWIRPNHQTRMPKRWIAFDTESDSTRDGDTEIQSWGTGAAIRWRTDLKTGDHREEATFSDAKSLWLWVRDYCKPGHRTVAVAHNLGHDIRIASALEVLPALGFTLEWCNLDRNVSSMTWRSDYGTLVLCDSWTWLPLDIATIGPTIDLPKLPMPQKGGTRHAWERYCLRDAEIVYRCMSEIIHYIQSEQLGNWQPTGAGMAYATWRHKFLDTRPLVHDDIDALKAERHAMHTGRAEAWRHGELLGDLWTEVDLRNAYTAIAAECDLPVKLKMKVGAITNAQYARLRDTYRVVANCDITSHTPSVPCNYQGRTIWPEGSFRTWLWDTEVDQALRDGSTVRIRQAYLYTRGPALQEWAKWVLSLLRSDTGDVSPVVQTWLKHCARALIGRIALRCPSWELFGGNPDCVTGISYDTNSDTGETLRLMHIGERTFVETARTEGRDSLPQITGWIMAECRVRLWRAMQTAGLSEVAHVDTDSLIVSRVGLDRLRAAGGAGFAAAWQVKGTYRRMIVYGPRNYRGDKVRKVAGVPRKAKEVLPNVFTGEKWSALSSDLEAGRPHFVTVTRGDWAMTQTDPRRLDASGAGTGTTSYQVGVMSSAASPSSANSGDGA